MLTSTDSDVCQQDNYYYYIRFGLPGICSTKTETFIRKTKVLNQRHFAQLEK